MWLNKSFLPSVRTLFHVMESKQYKIASQQITKILYEDQSYSKGSQQFIKLLHLQAILQFNLREFQDSEVSLQNAVLQSSEYEHLHKSLITQYYLLLSLTNPSELVMENKTEAWKKYYNNDKKFLAKLKIAMAIGNDIESEEELLESVEMLRSASILKLENASDNYLNISVLHFLFNTNANRNNEIIKNICLSFNYLQKQKLKSIEDIWTFYSYKDISELYEQDVKLLLFVSQFLLQIKQTKLSLLFLNLGYKKVNSNSLFKFYLSEYQFIYAAYFYDNKQKDSCRQLCIQLQTQDLHPIHDYLRIIALKLEKKCTQEMVNTQKPKGAHRQVQKQSFKSVKDKEEELQEKWNIPENGQNFFQFYTDLRTQFAIDNYIFNYKLFE